MTSNLVEVWVSNIRKKAGAAGVGNVIKTRRGFGYYVEQALVVNSIQGKLTVYIIAGTMIVLVAVGLIIDAQLSRQLENEFNRSLLAKAMTMVTLTEQDNGIVEFDLVEELAPEFTPGDRYWIDHEDLVSKRVFLLMLFLTTLTNRVTDENAPVLTIPTS